MMGPGFGQALGAQIAGLILIAFASGGLLALGGYLLVSWLAAHLSIGWN